MASRKINVVEELLKRFEPALAAEFRAAIESIKNAAQIKAIETALERGDIDGAVRALGLDPLAFRGMENLIAAAFEAGGAATVGAMPGLKAPDGSRLVLRFDVRNMRAERWLRENSSRLVTRIVEDQRAAIRTALRIGMEAGRNPRNVALDIIGRINPLTKRRQGGIVGLSGQQEQFVRSAREELLSGDPALMRHFLTRTRRDRRFDSTVFRAISSEKPVSSVDISRIVGRYADSLLQLRGETIARTEMLASLNQSQLESFRQAIDTGAVREQDVRRVWEAVGDSRTRDGHAAMQGESVGMNENFSNGLAYPGDPSGPPEEVINCRCNMSMRIDFLANIGR